MPSTDPAHMTRMQKRNLALFNHMLMADSLRPVFEISKVWALLLALCVHAITLGLIGLGIYLIIVGIIVKGATLVGLFFCAALCIAIAWHIAPHPPRMLPKQILSRKACPTLYRITNRVAHSLGIRLVEGIAVTPYFNAHITRVGWKRKPYLLIGIPLWLSLTDQERIALIAHELSHEANGDFGNSFIVRTACDSLTKWFVVFNPPVRIIGAHNFFTSILGTITWAMLYALRWQLFHESRRAEYYADSLAADISGTDSMSKVLTKLNFAEEFPKFVKRMVAMRRNDHLLEKFRDYIADASPEKYERVSSDRRTREALYNLTHPPLELRIEFLKSRYVADAAVQMTPAESESLKQETLPLQATVEDLLLKSDPNAFVLR